MGDELEHIRRALERRFGCACTVTEIKRPSGRLLAVLYDTAWLPSTWEAFVSADDELCATMRAFLLQERGVAAGAGIRIEHAARRPRRYWLPAGTDGVVAVDAPPAYFERTGQTASFHQELHTGTRFWL
jgi:hypothetical protein